MTVSPRLYGVKGVREDDPLPHVRIHDLRVVDDGAEHDQPAGTAGLVFLDGLIELAQGKPYPHAESRCFGAQYYCHCLLLGTAAGLADWL